MCNSVSVCVCVCIRDFEFVCAHIQTVRACTRTSCRQIYVRTIVETRPNTLISVALNIVILPLLDLDSARVVAVDRQSTRSIVNLSTFVLSTVCYVLQTPVDQLHNIMQLYSMCLRVSTFS